MIRKIADRLVDLIFPKRCPVCQDIVMPSGQDICEKCKSKLKYIEDPYCLKCGRPLNGNYDRCESCKNTSMDYIEGRAVFVYNDTLRKSIYGFKYNGRLEYASFYGNQIVKRLNRKLMQWNADAIIPIPLHKDRLKKRGYNQADILAKEISKYLKVPLYSDYLIRQKATKAQKNLDALARENNLKNAFKIKPNGVKLRTVILVDDIYTTGSTINSAARCLKNAGVERVYFVVISCAVNSK